MTTAALFFILLLCLLTGMPIAFALGLSSITTILIFSNDSLASIALKLYASQSEHYTLLAIPFFILSSTFLSTGALPTELLILPLTVSAGSVVVWQWHQSWPV